MPTITVPRGAVTDILFTLRTVDGGSLADDDQYTDGSTAGQWPVAVVKNASNVDVTAQWAKDITGDSIDPAWKKHPVPSTGQIRMSVGKYRFRVNPAPALPLANYTLTITVDLNGAPFQISVTLALVQSGSIDVGQVAIYCTEQDVLDNFELSGIVTSDEILKARVRADRMVNSFLARRGISVPQAVIDPLNLAGIAFSRAELRRLKSGVIGPGLGVARVKEGDTEFQFQSGDKQFAALYDEGVEWMDVAIDALLGMAYFRVTSRSPRMGSA